jgi:acetyltransferase-like isoleucine patch superfamily enzyme
MFIQELIKKVKFWKECDRIGADIPWTHWRLYFRSTMTKLCKEKFFHFGENSEIRPYVYVIGCSQVHIGKNVILRPNTMIHAKSDSIDVSVFVDDNVLVGSGVHIYVENHAFERNDVDIIEQGHSKAKKVTLRKGCWIGANVVILPGVEIGENAVVAAGSIVTKSVPSRTLAGGNPAKVIKIL